jgi:glyceraldehyde 3-phosphate dehydrogenase
LLCVGFNYIYFTAPALGGQVRRLIICCRMKKIRVAINGFGRIGRHALKVAQKKENIQVVAVNDLTDPKTLTHLLKYDTAYPDFDEPILFDGEYLVVGENKISIFQEKDPTQLPWGALEVDVVIESTGVFRTKEAASKHIEAGAKKVVISAPGKGDGIASFVRGVNDADYSQETVFDGASCTTNCTAPVMLVMEEAFGVKQGMISTIHSYTADQRLQDSPHKDLRRARAAAQNIIPTSTGAAIATTRVIPSLENKFDGMAIRVPAITVSLTDFTLVLKKDVTVEEVNNALRKASEGKLKGILHIVDEPLVSSDFIGNPYSSNVDVAFTNVVGGSMVKIISWYDNEWGYANRLVELVELAGK